MRAYLILLIAALLFWGWAIDTLWLGGLLGLILLTVFVLGKKYTFEVASFYHVANLCALIVGAIFAFFWLDETSSKATFPTLKLLPLACLPILLIQYLHTSARIPSNTFLFFKRDTEKVASWVDISILFFTVCLLSAGAVKHQDSLYFTGVSALLLIFFLIRLQAKFVVSYLLLIALFLTAESLGMGIQLGVSELQKRFEASLNQWFLNQYLGNKASTAIGAVGRLKLSDEIVFRVDVGQVLVQPMLFKQGSYTRYHHQTWYGGAWKNVDVALEGGKWQLHPQSEHTKSVKIYQIFTDDIQTLALPKHAVSIQYLPAKTVYIKQGGRVEAHGAPPFSAFVVSYTNKAVAQGSFQSSDLWIAQSEANAVSKFAKLLKLKQIKYEMGAKKAVDVLHQYFMQKFTYSTWLDAGNLEDTRMKENTTALANFLLNSQSGHCEYFASATVLLLRELGIPARYVVGYSVSEWDESTGLYVVRGRDAHAWVVALIDGEWVDIDNTPPDWFAIENARKHGWFPHQDWLSNLVFYVKKWRYTDDEKDTIMWYWLLGIMFVFLAFRVLRRVRAMHTNIAEKHSHVNVNQAWLRLEKDLSMLGCERHQGETISSWFMRIKHDEWLNIARLYEKQCYAEHGLNKNEQQTLDAALIAMRQVIH